LAGAETVQERPLLSWKGKTRLPDCGVVHQVGIEVIHALSNRASFNDLQ